MPNVSVSSRTYASRVSSRSRPERSRAHPWCKRMQPVTAMITRQHQFYCTTDRLICTDKNAKKINLYPNNDKKTTVCKLLTKMWNHSVININTVSTAKLFLFSFAIYVLSIGRTFTNMRQDCDMSKQAQLANLKHLNINNYFYNIYADTNPSLPWTGFIVHNLPDFLLQTSKFCILLQTTLQNNHSSSKECRTQCGKKQLVIRRNVVQDRKCPVMSSYVGSRLKTSFPAVMYAILLLKQWHNHK